MACWDWRARLAAATMIVAGCTDVTGLSGGSPDAAVADDGGSVSPTVPDAVEAGLDAGLDAGEAGPFCAPGMGFFCEDFDQSPLGFQWSGSRIFQGALTLDHNAKSPPFALKANITTGPKGSTAYLFKTLPSLPATTCEFDMKFLATLPSGELDLIDFLQWGTDPYEDELYFFHSSSGWQLGDWLEFGDGGVMSNSVVTQDPSVGWLHVTFRVEDKTLSLSMNGQDAGTLDRTTPAMQADAGVELEFGITSSAVGSATSALFDNLVCRRP